MEKEEFVRGCCTLGICYKGEAIMYADQKDGELVEEDYIDAYRKYHPECVGSAPLGGLKDDEPEYEIPEEEPEQKPRRVNRDFVNDCYSQMEKKGLLRYEPEPTYIRDEHMRLVLNPKRLKGM